MIKPLRLHQKSLLLAGIILIGAFFRLHQIASLPPGDGYDPAHYGLDALQILDGARPVYLATNFGREPLFSYLVAGAFLFLKPGTFAIHLVSAFVAIITLPAAYLVSDEFFRFLDGRLIRRYGGLLTTTILALSYWHLNWSRYGVRAILIPLFFSLTIFFLLRGLRRGGSRYFIVSGLLLGFSLYTYQLAQLLPAVVLLAFVYDLISRRSFTRRDALHILFLFGSAIIIALPLAYYAYNHPGIFNRRVGDVYILDRSVPFLSQIPLLLDGAWRVFLMFVYQGDGDGLINIPYQPAFNPFLAVFFIAGITVCLWRWRRPYFLFLLSWLAIMMTPAMLADSAALGKRALGSLSATIIFISLGLLFPLDTWLRRKQNVLPRRATTLYTIFIVGGLIFTAFSTYRDYFIRWGTNPVLYDHYDVGVSEIGEYIYNLPPEDAIYLSPTWGEHASLLLHSGQREDIHAYNGRNCFVFPEQTNSETTYIIVPRDEKNSLPSLTAYFPSGQPVYEGILDNGEHYFTVFQIPAGVSAQVTPQRPLEVNWDNKVGLLGVDLDMRQFHPGEDVIVTLYYQPLADMGDNYTVFVHLWGEPDPVSGNFVYGQTDREPCYQSYPTSSWQVGEVIRDTFIINIPPDIQPGTYHLATGFYKWPELNQLPLLDTATNFEGNAVILGAIDILD